MGIFVTEELVQVAEVAQICPVFPVFQEGDHGVEGGGTPHGGVDHASGPAEGGDLVEGSDVFFAVCGQSFDLRLAPSFRVQKL